jgi:Tfp pilus assembly protein PilV
VIQVYPYLAGRLHNLRAKIELRVKQQLRSSNQSGFTLIELISILIIIGVLGSVGVKKYDLLSDTASLTVLKAGIRELNTRETVMWSKIKLSDTGYTNDEDVYNGVDKNVGPGYSWNPGPEISGGTLWYKSQSVDLNRSQSTSTKVGFWK